LKNAIKHDRGFVGNPKKTAAPPNKQNPELYLVHLMLADKELALQIKQQITIESFQDPDLRQIAELFYQLIDKGCGLRVDLAIDRVDKPSIKALLSEIGIAPIPFDNLKQTAVDCIHAMRKRSLELKLEELKKQRNEALIAGESKRFQKLQDKLSELRMTLSPG